MQAAEPANPDAFDKFESHGFNIFVDKEMKRDEEISLDVRKLLVGEMISVKGVYSPEIEFPSCNI